MRPLKLTLEGFIGVRDGMKQRRLELDLESLPLGLIALTGPNGAGKSTIMDNLHPYRIMPSRAARLSVDAFSYWDHLCAPHALKEFEWEHDGQRYRSMFAFRKPGKTGKAEYFLACLTAAGEWAPYVAPDGTVADGKADTYDRCVEAICGSLESFFTSVFSAQNRRPLASYGASEIKGLLAELLQIDHLRNLAAKASEVGKALNVALVKVQGDLQVFASKREQHQSLGATIARLGADLQGLQATRSALAVGLEKAVQLRATLLAKQAERGTADARLLELAGRRRELLASIADIDDRRGTADIAFKRRTRDLRQMIERHAVTLQQRDNILGALQVRDKSLENVAAAEMLIGRLQVTLADFDIKRTRHATLSAQITSMASDGKSKAELVKQLDAQAAVIDTVPCQGQSIHATCPLLAQAHKAAATAHEHRIALEALRKTFAQCRAEADGLSPVLQQFIATQYEMQVATQALVASRKALQQASELSAKRGLLDEAELATSEAKKELESLQDAAVEAAVRAEAEAKQVRKQLAEVDAEAERLASVDVSAEIAKIDLQLGTERQALTAADARIEAVIRTQAARETERDELQQQLRGAESTEAQVKRISEEISHWKLLAKGLGNDGVIALTIDDAGPALTKLANDLLLECYGHRFTVDIRTQRSLANGELREGFDILVHDAESEESKPVTVMSGGEKVWINECLTRGIALYLGNNARQPYRTLFSDETDGPLDPNRKVQFIRMKRAVLRLGGYEREFFVSQTPELVAEADATVNVAMLAA